MKRYLAALLITLCALNIYAQDEQAAVDRFAAAKGMKHASAGVVIYDIEGDSVIASHLADQAIVTASTMKTVTSVAALELLGGDFRFKTEVWLGGDIVGDTLCGNITIVGAGDPTLGSSHMTRQANIVDEIVNALKEKGVRVVEGKIVTDESLYPFPPYSIHWDVGDLAWDYGAAVHPLNYADNVMRVTFSVDKWGRFSTFHLKPDVPGVEVINKMTFSSVRDIDYALEYAHPAIIFSGPASAGNYAFVTTNPTPAALLADRVTAAAKRAGISFTQQDTDHERNKRQLLLTHLSPELTDIITSLLDRSDNMFTHALLRAIGVNSRQWNGGNPDPEAIKRVKKVLNSLRADSEALFMRDGSGLARAGKASPLMFAQMLAHVAQKEYNGKRMTDLMPRAGKRIGTLLPNTSLSKNISLKSGSMTDVQCFVGYYPADNPRYTFAILANNYTCSRPELKNLMDRLLIDVFGKK